MEIMAIMAATAITPSSVPLEIRTDSQAAAHMMDHVTAPTATRELTNSPDAFLWLHLRSWMQSREAPVTTVWVRATRETQATRQPIASQPQPMTTHRQHGG